MPKRWVRDIEGKMPKRWENRGKKDSEISLELMTRESRVAHWFCHPELVSGSLK